MNAVMSRSPKDAIVLTCDECLEEFEVDPSSLGDELLDLAGSDAASKAALAEIAACPRCGTYNRSVVAAIFSRPSLGELRRRYDHCQDAVNSPYGRARRLKREGVPIDRIRQVLRVPEDVSADLDTCLTGFVMDETFTAIAGPLAAHLGSLSEGERLAYFLLKRRGMHASEAVRVLRAIYGADDATAYGIVASQGNGKKKVRPAKPARMVGPSRAAARKDPGPRRIALAIVGVALAAVAVVGVLVLVDSRDRAAAPEVASSASAPAASSTPLLDDMRKLSERARWLEKEAIESERALSGELRAPEPPATPAATASGAPAAPAVDEEKEKARVAAERAKAVQAERERLASFCAVGRRYRAHWSWGSTEGDVDLVMLGVEPGSTTFDARLQIPNDPSATRHVRGKFFTDGSSTPLLIESDPNDGVSRDAKVDPFRRNASRRWLVRDAEFRIRLGIEGGALVGDGGGASWRLTQA